MLEHAYRLFCKNRLGLHQEAQKKVPILKRQYKVKKIILNKTNGKNISLLTHIDSSLLGGLIVKYGSKMIDTSIRTKLNNLELAMKGAN